jgi:56kDa selenium binding protein (SBP56)
MVEISCDDKCVYWTNLLYSTWENQFYPDGVPSTGVMANVGPSLGDLHRRISGTSDPPSGRRPLHRFGLLSIGWDVRAVKMTAALLWLAVVSSSLYHGVSPAMGWRLVVSAGLMGRSSRAVAAALGPLMAGLFWRCSQ